MTITTSPNILTTIDIPLTGLNIKNQRWEIKYNISQTNLIEGKTTLIVSNRTITILPEDMVEWMASWDGEATLTEQSYQRVIAHENIVEWDENVIIDIENDPEAETILPWSVGELVAPPNRRSYEGKVYLVKLPHRTLPILKPDTSTNLFEYLFDDENGVTLPIWSQLAVYSIGNKVKRGNKCYESAIDNNEEMPGGQGIGDDIWFEITCP